MKRILLIGASLALGIWAASQISAAPRNFSSGKQASPSSSNSSRVSRNFNAPTGPKLGGFPSGGISAHKGQPFQSPQKFDSIKPKGPIGQSPIKTPKPFHPIVTNPGFPKPVKPIKPVDPIVKPFNPGFPIKPIDKPGFPIKPIKPIKPIDSPIANPWPIKPIKPHCPPDKHCPPHKHSPCYPWWGGSGYVVHKPICIEVPVAVGAQPVIEVAHLTEVYVGSTLQFPAQDIGMEAGTVVLKIGDMTLGCLVNAWSNDSLQATLPMIGLEQPKAAEILVVMPDGTFGLTLPVKLLPALPPEEVQ